MGKKKIRVGLIGCGSNMRGGHIPRLQADGAVDLVAVADTAAEPARLTMESWGAETGYYPDYARCFAPRLSTGWWFLRPILLTMHRCVTRWTGGCTFWSKSR